MSGGDFLDPGATPLENPALQPATPFDENDPDAAMRAGPNEKTVEILDYYIVRELIDGAMGDHPRE